MLEEKTRIGPGLLFVLVFTALGGYGFMQAPYLAARYTGANGYWGVVAAFLLTLPLLWIVFLANRRFPGQSIVSILRRLLGGFIGSIAALLYLLFVFAVVQSDLQDMMNLINLYLLPRTPLAFVLALLIAPALYLARKGIETISRTAAFMFVFVFLLTGATLIASCLNINADYLAPAFYRPGRIAIGAIPLFYPFLPLVALFSAMKYFSRPQGMPRAITWASFLSTVLLFIAVAGTIGTFGAKSTVALYGPLVELTRQTNIPHLLQSFSLAFNPAVIFQFILAEAWLLWTIADGCGELTRRKTYRGFTWLVGAALFVPAWLLGRKINGLQYFRFISESGFFFVYGFLGLIALAVLARRDKEDPHGP